ncbi:MAG: hypothetical protein RJB47_1033 [Pseudomonadota bacterium]
MSNILLSAHDLTVRFGGVLAVNGVSFDVRQGEVFTLIGPNGAGKTTVFNLISRIYTATSGHLDFQGQRLSDVPPHAVAAMGIARTFQNIELFEHATVCKTCSSVGMCTTAPVFGARCCSLQPCATPNAQHARKWKR